MAIRKNLLEILACPKCKSPVVERDDALWCTKSDCGLIYPIRDGIPIMLIAEALPRDKAGAPHG